VGTTYACRHLEFLLLLLPLLPSLLLFTQILKIEEAITFLIYSVLMMVYEDELGKYFNTCEL
jgi:hypothetical protein